MTCKNVWFIYLFMTVRASYMQDFLVGEEVCVSLMHEFDYTNFQVFWGGELRLGGGGGGWQFQDRPPSV